MATAHTFASGEPRFLAGASPDSLFVVVARDQPVLDVYDTRGPSWRHRAALRHDNTAHQILFSPDGTVAVSSDMFGLYLWEVGSFKPLAKIAIAKLAGEPLADIGQIAWGPGPSEVTVRTGVIGRLYRAKVGRTGFSLLGSAPLPKIAGAGKGRIASLDTTRTLVLAPGAAEIVAYDWKRGQTSTLPRLPSPLLAGAGGNGTVVCLSQNGSVLTLRAESDTWSEAASGLQVGSAYDSGIAIGGGSTAVAVSGPRAWLVALDGGGVRVAARTDMPGYSFAASATSPGALLVPLGGDRVQRLAP